MFIQSDHAGKDCYKKASIYVKARLGNVYWSIFSFLKRKDDDILLNKLVNYYNKMDNYVIYIQKIAFFFIITFIKREGII